MNEKLRMIRTVSNRLVVVLTVLLCIIVPASFYVLYQGDVPTALAIFAVGVVGGVVGLQRRLKQMSDDDLTLLANSWVYVCLSPLTGGVLAVVTYILFVSGMLQGELFPQFVPDDPSNRNIGLRVLFAVHCATGADYGKALLWGFVAGFSERFATDIISRFESNATSENKKGP
jgi:Flp pilus assembly protein protease CpaA